jgi:hypothetical protein
VIFPELPWDTQTQVVEPGVLAEGATHAGQTVVQPEGGRWPHVDGQPWTEAERAALFIMRHRDRLTGERLAAIAGVKRQRIDELIGLAKPHGGLAKAVSKDGWRPSPELLSACGGSLQSLQTVALVVSR